MQEGASSGSLDEVKNSEACQAEASSGSIDEVKNSEACQAETRQRWLWTRPDKIHGHLVSIHWGMWRKGNGVYGEGARVIFEGQGGSSGEGARVIFGGPGGYLGDHARVSCR